MTDPDRAPSPTPRIHRLKIEGMRVIEKLDVELRPMNVLIGENGSGKTTVLEALEILRKAATLPGEDFVESLYQSHGGERLFRLEGGAASKPLRLELGIHLGPEEPYRYSLAMRAVRGGGIVIHEEQLLYGPAQGYDRALEVINRRGGHATLWHAGKVSEMDVGVRELVLPTMRASSPEKPVTHRVSSDASRVRELLAAIAIYPPTESNPPWATLAAKLAPSRSPVILRPALSVAPGGANLPNVYHALKNRGQQAWEAVLSTLRIGLGEDVEDVLVEPSPSGGEVSLALRFRGLGVIPAFSLSDGQLSYLQQVAVFTLERPGITAFDEPDGHLHPSMVSRVVELAENASDQRTVLFTTHSDRLLDALSDPLDSVILFERDSRHRTVALRPNSARLAHWLEKYAGLGRARAEGYGSTIFTEPATAEEEAQ